MNKLYYGWVIVAVGFLVNMAGLGFSRWAYAMLLSSMRTSLEFNYIQMGLLSGGILLGYLLFSLIGGALTTKFGAKRVVVASLLCGFLSMLFLSRLSSFVLLLFFSFAMGASGGGVHISMTTLSMAWFEKKRRGRALGVVTGGTGLGIVFTGLLLPYLLSTLGGDAWRHCWALLALITLVVVFMGFVLLKDKPNVSPSASADPVERSILPIQAKKSGLTLRVIIIHYFIFGFAYNIYATYFATYMVDEVLVPGKTAGFIWSIFGWTCLASGLIWGFLSDRLGRGKALFWNNVIISIAVLLPLVFTQAISLGLSSFLFGMAFLGTVTIVAACVGDLLMEKAATVYGLITLIHGIGQFLGTTWGGYLKDLTGSFQITLLSSLLGFLFCLALILICGTGEKNSPSL